MVQHREQRNENWLGPSRKKRKALSAVVRKRRVGIEKTAFEKLGVSVWSMVQHLIASTEDRKANIYDARWRERHTSRGRSKDRTGKKFVVQWGTVV